MKTPLVIHVFNITGLLVLNLILLGTVIKPWHLVILVPILALTISYYPLRANPNIMASYFAISIVMLFWVVICENIVAIDNHFGTKISTSLVLGPSLQSHVEANLTPGTRRQYLQKCCGDPVSFNLKPGSKFSQTYDCATCNERYQTIADETGYLNRQFGLMERNSYIDLFVAGDSVMQGIGMPSVLEAVREKVHIKMWNLSIGGYGPRQKINALITYALPKHPKWLVVEFYSGNDVSDAIEYKICEAANDFHCRFNSIELNRLALEHPVYRVLVAESDRIHAIDRYAENSLTLAVSRYFIHSTKDILRERLMAGLHQPRIESVKNANDQINPNILATPAGAYVDIRSGKRRDWVKAGITVVHQDYERLIARVAKMETQPKIVLLYNPTGYEVYRDILIDRNPNDDEISRFQIDEQTSFARKYGWIFLNLTEPLRNEVRETKTWIYGRYDGSHWSHKGTAVVASVLSAELSKLTKN